MPIATTPPVLTAIATGVTGQAHLTWTPPLWDTSAFPGYVVNDYAVWYTLTDPAPPYTPFPTAGWVAVYLHGPSGSPGGLPGTATSVDVNTGVNALTHYLIDAAIGPPDYTGRDIRNYSNVATATPYSGPPPTPPMAAWGVLAKHG